MIARFTLYDVIANVVPGLFFMWAASVILALPGRPRLISFSGDLGQTSLLIATSYIIGSLLQALSERFTEKRILLKLWNGFPSARWLRSNDSYLSADYKNQLFKSVEKRFGISPLPDANESAALRRNQEIFYLCYQAVDKTSERPQIFNAQYGLFRCLLTVFALLELLVISNAIMHPRYWTENVPVILALLSIGAVAMWLSYARCKKRAEDFAKAVLDLFLVLNQKAD